MTAALAAVLAAGILTAWVRERWAVSIVEVGSFLLALAWAGRPVVRPAALIPLGFMACWGAVQMAVGWSADFGATAGAVVNWAGYLAIAFAAAQTFAVAGERERFLRWLLWFGTGLAAVSTLQAFLTPGRVFWIFPIEDPVFLMGPFRYHSHYAAFVALILPLALMRGRALVGGILVASVIVSASRGGFVVVAVEAVVLLIWTGRQRWRAGVSIGVLALVVGWGTLAGRFVKPGSYEDRVQMMVSSVSMFRDHAATGVGLGAWTEVFPGYARHDTGEFANQAHSDWLQWASEGGVLAVASQGLLLGWMAGRIRRSPWLMGVAFVYLYAGFDYLFQKPQLASLIFVMAMTGAGRETELPRGKLEF